MGTVPKLYLVINYDGFPKEMSVNKFQNWSRLNLRRVHTNILGRKGKEISYSEKIEMAEYLMPNSELTIEDQQKIFEIRK